MILFNDSGLLRLWAQVPEDIRSIEVYNYYIFLTPDAIITYILFCPVTGTILLNSNKPLLSCVALWNRQLLPYFDNRNPRDIIV